MKGSGTPRRGTVRVLTSDDGSEVGGCAPPAPLALRSVVLLGSTVVRDTGLHPAPVPGGPVGLGGGCHPHPRDGDLFETAVVGDHLRVAASSLFSFVSRGRGSRQPLSAVSRGGGGVQSPTPPQRLRTRGCPAPGQGIAWTSRFQWPRPPPRRALGLGLAPAGEGGGGGGGAALPGVGALPPLSLSPPSPLPPAALSRVSLCVVYGARSPVSARYGLRSSSPLCPNSFSFTSSYSTTTRRRQYENSRIIAGRSSGRSDLSRRSPRESCEPRARAGRSGVAPGRAGARGGAPCSLPGWAGLDARRSGVPGPLPGSATGARSWAGGTRGPATPAPRPGGREPGRPFDLGPRASILALPPTARARCICFRPPLARPSPCAGGGGEPGGPGMEGGARRATAPRGAPTSRPPPSSVPTTPGTRGRSSRASTPGPAAAGPSALPSLAGFWGRGGRAGRASGRGRPTAPTPARTRVATRTSAARPGATTPASLGTCEAS